MAAAGANADAQKTEANASLDQAAANHLQQSMAAQTINTFQNIMNSVETEQSALDKLAQTAKGTP